MLEFFFLFVSVLSCDPWRDRAITIRDDLTSRIDRDKKGERDEKSEKSCFVHGTFLQATKRETIPSLSKGCLDIFRQYNIARCSKKKAFVSNNHSAGT